jgi:hypothetical protein
MLTATAANDSSGQQWAMATVSISLVPLQGGARIF